MSRFRWNVAIGPRTVLALTCLTCGVLKPGSEFGRRWRGTGPWHPGKTAYIDRRCKPCRWKHIEDARGGAGRNE